MKSTLKIWIYIVLALVLSVNANSQFKGLSFSAGLSNYWIIGDNPANKPIFERDTNKAFIYGGGYGGVQPGITAKFSFALDEKEDWVLPIGFDLSFFDSRERIPVTAKTTAYLVHYAYLPTGSIGINYAAFRFPYVDVKAIVGLDAKLHYINQGYLYQRIEYKTEDISDIREIRTKESTFRLGGIAYLGFEGVIMKPLFLEALFGIGSMNFLGTDDTRYELLTPRKDFESGESPVYNTYFSLMLKYKF